MGPSGPGWLPAADRLLVVEPIALHEACVPCARFGHSCRVMLRSPISPLCMLQQRRLRPSACSICARVVQIAPRTAARRLFAPQCVLSLL